VWLDADRQGRDTEYRAARGASRPGGHEPVIAILDAVPVRAGNRRLHDLVGRIRHRKAGGYPIRAGGEDCDLEWIYEQLRGRGLRDHHSYDSAKGEYGSPHSPSTLNARPFGRARARIKHQL